MGYNLENVRNGKSVCDGLVVIGFCLNIMRGKILVMYCFVSVIYG